MIPKFRVYIKHFNDINEHHFNQPFIGRMHDVIRIDFEEKIVWIRCPSEIDLPFEQVGLMQYTGLKDKNGKEIYERDVGSFYFEGLGEPEIYIGTIEYMGMPFAAWGFLDAGNKTALLEFDLEEIEILGNIHENPELIIFND